MFVKICGLSTPEAVETAVESGADALGFVFAESPRRVSPSRARELCAGLPRGVVRVAVMRHPSVSEWQEVAHVFAPDWLQTDAGDFGDLGPLDCESLPVFRNGAGTRDAPLPARILFEGSDSGTGETADWGEAARVAAMTDVILAGGLDSDNVDAAIRTVKPWGVDVSSGVEKSRGIKDPALIRKFISRVRETE